MRKHIISFQIQDNFLRISKKLLTNQLMCDILICVAKQATHICESGGTGRRARLRGVWIHRTGSSPVSRTIVKQPLKAALLKYADVAERQTRWIQVPV